MVIAIAWPVANGKLAAVKSAAVSSVQGSGVPAGGGGNVARAVAVVFAPVVGLLVLALDADEFEPLDEHAPSANIGRAVTAMTRRKRIGAMFAQRAGLRPAGTRSRGRLSPCRRMPWRVTSAL